jgi:RNA polymerase sigma-70 factor (ECF subfamily)
LLHEVFVQALRSIQSVQDGTRLKAWLTTIAVYTARGCIRKRQRFRWLGYRDPAQLPPIEGANADPEVLEALRTVYLVLESLPADLRIPFSLRYVDKMELTEVAEACDVSLATIKRRLSKAEQRFVRRARRETSLVPWVQKHPRWRDL